MKAQDFGRFLEGVHGHRPFSWQQHLAERVIEEKDWPDVIAVPTAAGKTAVIDLAVFALASSVEAQDAPAAPRRIFFVIDRRIVVDSTFERASRLADALADARDGIVREVADRLLSLGGDSPLQVAALRGGMFLDHGWARSPVQPLVCVSTVDQVGSRLLFRGYGLSTGTKNLLPIHAGLVGNDALVILDEAHLSRPFGDTLAAIARYRTWADSPVDTQWVFVRLTATPQADAGEALREGPEDRADPVLGPRLSAWKPARLVNVKTEAATKSDAPDRRRSVEQENRERLVGEICRQALSIVEQDSEATAIGIVVNRVATARSVFERLDQGGTDAILLIGPVRPWDRDRVLKRYLPRLRAGRERGTNVPSLFVVATQCIEVGADLDFDALVTECAPLDALRQRFGRLDRLGQRGKSQAVIVIRHDDLKAADDPVYGESLSRTWKWLQERARVSGGTGRGGPAVIDMGINSLAPLLGADDLSSLVPTPRRAPVMLPAHLDLWVQTSPIPLPDPDPALFLHGPVTDPADVSLVWRADLRPDDPDSWADVVALAPPSSVEALPVPVYAVRRWLGRQREEDIADVEGVSSAEAGSPGSGRIGLRWRGPRSEDTITVQPDAIRPGDTIVVPASYGGTDEFGWNPASPRPVRDIADGVSVSYRRTPLLRLHPDVVPSLLPGVDQEALGPVLEALHELRSAIDGGPLSEAEDGVLEALVAVEGAEGWIREAALELRRDPGRRRSLYPDGSGVVLTAGGRRMPSVAEGALTDEDDNSLLTRPVPLADHSEGVAHTAQRFAVACGVPPSLAEDLRLAGWLHDVGKADPRFQVMLCGGDEVAAVVAEEPLAKSGMDPRDRAGFRRAFERSGLPRGYRHEATSLALLETGREALAEASDPDLVLHLVASHHGAARPFLPPIQDEDTRVSLHHGPVEFGASTRHELARLDSGVAERFWRLLQKYGWYGLAYLEAILRLADHHRSEEEAAPGGAS